jgi:hypothetical protein
VVILEKQPSNKKEWDENEDDDEVLGGFAELNRAVGAW